MVIPGHEVTPADRIMEDRLCAALKQLVCGRSLTEATLLIEHFNRALDACQAEAEPAAEPTRH